MIILIIYKGLLLIIAIIIIVRSYLLVIIVILVMIRIVIIVIIVMLSLFVLLLRSVFIIPNRRISNRASQILKTNMLLMCPYCLKFQIARV